MMLILWRIAMSSWEGGAGGSTVPGTTAGGSNATGALLDEDFFVFFLRFFLAEASAMG